MPSQHLADSATQNKPPSRRERCGARRKLLVTAGFDSLERNVPVDLKRHMLFCTEALRRLELAYAETVRLYIRRTQADLRRALPQSEEGTGDLARILMLYAI